MAAASATAAATNADVRIRRIIISSSLGGLISRSDLRLNIGRCQSSFAVAVVMPALVRSPARPGQAVDALRDLCLRYLAAAVAGGRGHQPDRRIAAAPAWPVTRRATTG